MTSLDKKTFLDGDPFDPLALLAVADSLEEEGEQGLAQAFRLIHSRGLQPQYHDHEGLGPYWWRVEPPHDPEPATWHLTAAEHSLARQVSDQERNGYSCWLHFPSRSDAYFALAHALRENT